jgi:hypothetical protein
MVGHSILRSGHAAKSCILQEQLPRGNNRELKTLKDFFTRSS